LRKVRPVLAILLATLHAIFLAVFVACTGNLALAQPREPPEQRPSNAPADRAQLLAERSRLLKELAEAQSKADIKSAIALAEQVLSVEKRAFGESSAPVAASLERLGQYRAAIRDFDGASQWYSQKLSVVTKLYGADDWRTRHTRQAIRDMATSARLTPAQLDEVGQTNLAMLQIGKLAQKGELNQALEAVTKVWQTRTRLLGAAHASSIYSLNWLAQLQFMKGDYEKALALFRQLADIQKATLGEMHPQYAVTLTNLAQSSRQNGSAMAAEPLYARALEIHRKTTGVTDPEYTQLLDAYAELCIDLGRYKDAISACEEAIEIDKKTVGEQSPAYALALDRLGFAYAAQSNLTRAEALHRQALAIRKKVLGDKHPDYARSLHNLAVVYSQKWDFQRAEPLEQQAVAIRKELLQSQRTPAAARTYANALDSLGILYHRQGQYERAERCFEEAQGLRGIFLGNETRDYATSLVNRGEAYRSQGDERRAEQLFRQALAIRKRVLGDKHPDYAQNLLLLGRVLTARNDFAQAEALLRASLQITTTACGESHPSVAVCLNDLVYICEARADYTQAEPLARRAVEICRKSFGETHPEYGLTLLHLGLLCDLKGDSASAERFETQALEIEKQAVGEDSLQGAACNFVLARFYETQGNPQKGEPFFRRGLEATERLFNLSLLGQSERRQLELARKLHFRLEGYLALTQPQAARPADASEAYRHLLRWKGAVFLRQFATRRQPNHPELKPLVDELEAINVRLSTLALQGPPPNARIEWQAQVGELTDEKERHEKELSRQSAEFRQDQALQTIEPEQLKQFLPAEAALVDFLEYHKVDRHFPIKGVLQSTRCLVAFVVRRDRPIARIEFDFTEALEAAVANWRRKIVSGKGQPAKSGDGGTYPPEQFLRTQLWEPLSAHLDGVHLVLISPDGFLNQLPWNALPAAPDNKIGDSNTRDTTTRDNTTRDNTTRRARYLIEERQIAVVPVPRMIPRLLAENRLLSEKARLLSEKSTGKTAPDDSSLLVVGNIDFGSSTAPAGSPSLAIAEATPLSATPLSATHRSASCLSETHRSAARGSAALTFSALPGTAHEAESINALFATLFGKRAAELTGASATEDAFRSEAPKHRYLHVATHGFFADPGVPSAADRSPAAQLDDAYGFAMASKAEAQGLHPGLLSGLALAGANRGGQAELNSRMVDYNAKLADDGILTAVEVSALDLSRTDLVVLSACETGLGRTAGGEGVLGLQRAFQLAGAKTAITSLWKVDDTATQQLMQEFYTNLWQKRLGKLDALREAQLTMIARYDPQQKRLRARGLDVPETEASSQPGDPFYWAAFVLSGDWR
jgi:CHAT domain-containing protein